MQEEHATCRCAQKINRFSRWQESGVREGIQRTVKCCEWARTIRVVSCAAAMSRSSVRVEDFNEKVLHAGVLAEVWLLLGLNFDWGPLIVVWAFL